MLTQFTISKNHIVNITIHIRDIFNDWEVVKLTIQFFQNSDFQLKAWIDHCKYYLLFSFKWQVLIVCISENVCEIPEFD